jgi:hypothetical protein
MKEVIFYDSMAVLEANPLLIVTIRTVIQTVIKMEDNKKTEPPNISGRP